MGSWQLANLNPPQSIIEKKKVPPCFPGGTCLKAEMKSVQKNGTNYLHAKSRINEQETSEFFRSFRSATFNITNSY